MKDTIELVREITQFERPESYSCSYLVWDFLRELGETFGWRPAGTTYVAPPKRKIEIPVSRNYQPGDALDRKRVEADDAMAWAKALETARHSPHFDAIAKASTAASAADADALVARLSAETDEFARFAKGGAFTFALSAGDDTRVAEAREARRKAMAGRGSR